MHHFASSALTFFLSPFNWAWMLLILSFVLHKKNVKKNCRIAALIILIVFSNQWILDWVTRKWQAAPVSEDQLKVYSCGIVLGGFVSPDASGNGYFNNVADRFIEAEKLYKLGIIKHILISGGNGKYDNASFQEAAFAKQEFKIMDIPDSVIFVEDRSNDTYDNAVYAKHILDSVGLSPRYLMITSALHIPRAMLMFKNAGLQADAFPCNYIEGRGGFEFSDIIPKASAFVSWEHLLKEVAGYSWYTLFKKGK